MSPSLDSVRSSPGVVAWRCDCGAHSIEDRQPFVADELAAHLRDSDHALGEYFYGAPEERTRVLVRRNVDGTLDHQIDWS